MTEIEFSIARLAALGCSPYQIEEELRIPHYTIHQKYHDALQAGYARAAGLSYSQSDELQDEPPEPIERRSNKEKTAERKRRYEEKQEEIREQVREFIKAQEAKNAIKQEAKESLQTESR